MSWILFSNFKVDKRNKNKQQNPQIHIHGWYATIKLISYRILLFFVVSFQQTHTIQTVRLSICVCLSTKNKRTIRRHILHNFNNLFWHVVNRSKNVVGWKRKARTRLVFQFDDSNDINNSNPHNRRNIISNRFYWLHCRCRILGAIFQFQFHSEVNSSVLGNTRNSVHSSGQVNGSKK